MRLGACPTDTQQMRLNSCRIVGSRQSAAAPVVLPTPPIPSAAVAVTCPSLRCCAVTAIDVD
eukprot:2347482-Prymnesium_polylepis.2